MSSNSGKNLFSFDFVCIGENEFTKRKKRDEKQMESHSESETIKVKVYAIKLHKLIDAKNKKLREDVKKTFNTKRARDLIHSVCALYDKCLPDIGVQSIYDCICSFKALTLLVVKSDACIDKNKESDEIQDTESVYESDDCLDTLEDELPEQLSVFDPIFGEEEEDEDDSSTESDQEEDFTVGLKSFIEKNKASKSQFQSQESESRNQIFKSLVACATLQKVNTFQLANQDEWIVDLELLSVNKKHRGFNIGKYLIYLIQHRDYVGAYDAIVTASDLDAIEFYEKYGFSLDPILNSKYSNIGDIWTNTTKMCYIPPYSSTNEINKKSPAFKLTSLNEYSSRSVESKECLDMPSLTNLSLQTENQSIPKSTTTDDVDLFGLEEDSSASFLHELTNMEKDYKHWQKSMFNSYQSQAKLFIKFKQEILNLRAKLVAREGLIDELRVQNQLLAQKNKFLQLELDSKI
jgi:ribosomal protein S18 acetylase RimI-like enzyme